MKAISYLRFSHKKQTSGRSVVRQETTAEAFCARKGWTLDATVYADKGRSAFKNRHAETGQLGALLQAIKDDKIRPGDVIIIESCDRLSRAGIRKALNIWLQILDAGVSIQTLSPERLYTSDSTNDIASLIEPLIYFARANEESERKSGLGKDAWASRRTRAQETNRPLTSACPQWLKPVKADGKTIKFAPVAERKALVKRIFQMALDGMGSFAIARKLNREGVPSFGKDGWGTTYIHNLLQSRTVLGEYQPQRRTEAGRENVGNPIKGHYPAVVDAQTFWLVQGLLGARKGKEKGRRYDGCPNLFTGLLHDARDGMPLTLKNHGNTKQMVSKGAQRGLPGSTYVGFNYGVFEESILLFLRQSLTLAKATNNRTAEREAAEAELEAATIRLERIKADYATLDDPDVRRNVLDALTHTTGQVKRLTATVEKAKAEEQSDPQSDLTAVRSVMTSYYAACEAKKLIGELEKTTGRKAPDNVKEAAVATAYGDLREQLRTRLAALLTEVWVLNEARGKNDRTATVELHFKNDGRKALRIHVYRLPNMECEIENLEIDPPDLKHIRFAK